MNRMLSLGAALGLVLASAAGRAESTEYVFTLIDYPGATETMALGINDSGQIVGWYNDDAGAHGFTLSGGVYTPFDHPDAVVSGQAGGTGAYGVNSLGQIVGAYDASDGSVRGYLRNEDDYVDIVPFGFRASWARGINDNGTVVGIYKDARGVSRGFLFDGSSYTTFNDPEAVHTYPEEINNAGLIVGTGWESTGLPHPFVRDASGSFTSFYVDGFPGGATGINDLGQIVGDTGPASDDHWGFVLTGGVNATPDKLVAPGAIITTAQDINNLGQVIGTYATHGTWPDGPYRSFLATPIPEIPGDYNYNGVVDAADINAQAVAMQTPTQNLNVFDENGDGTINVADREIWVKTHANGGKGTWIGDADLNGLFNSSDFVTVFLAGKYESGENAGWEEGDWDGNLTFGSSDFVAAFLDGGYEQGELHAAVSAVPEPNSCLLLVLGLAGLVGRCRLR